MRIALLASSFPRFPGDGTAPFIQSIAENLVKLGHEVTVIAPYDLLVRPQEYPGYRVQRFKYIWPLKYHVMGHARSLEADAKLRPLAFLLLPFYLIGLFLAALAVVKNQRCDVMHVNWVLPNGPAGWLVSLLTGVPYVVSLHGSDMYIARKNRLYGWAARLVFRRARAVTACSRELRDAALALGAEEHKVQLLAWGADPDKFSPGDRLDLKMKLGLPPERKLVLAVGRLVYKKGFDRLLKAWRILGEVREEAHLLIAGAGPLRGELERQIAQGGMSGSVRLWGVVPWNEMSAFLGAGDIFVLPSVRDRYGNMDGLPTVLLEAMACGCAVIASDIGGVNLVVEDGRNGLLVPPGEEAVLGRALSELLADDERRCALGEAARRSVVERHHWYNVAISLADLLERA